MFNDNEMQQTENSFPQPLKSVEGWIIIVTQLHEQSMEDDIFDIFSKFGQVKSIHLNMDRRTGYAKGYALIEFQEFQEAESAIKQMNGQEIYEKKIMVDWAFQTQALKEKKKR